jgi:nucleoside 2-deoxyribosyltransferase
MAVGFFESSPKYMKKCFITGEACIHRTNITRERAENYGNDNVTVRVFVIMDYSNITDVLYKLRIRPLIDELKDHLLLRATDNDHSICIYSDTLKIAETLKDPCSKDSIKKVAEIRCTRADTSIASNYFICNRVCREIQVSDLVVVDVSTNNPNVFYEFGLASALGKAILPICNEDNYNKKIHNEYKDEYISSFFWRKRLFEFFSIHDKSDIIKFPDTVALYKTGDAEKPETDTSDSKYLSLPYRSDIGENFYKQLRGLTNRNEYDTLVLYSLSYRKSSDTVRKFINYNNLLKKLCRSNAFRGDRIGVLALDKEILKRHKEKADYMKYGFADMLLMGVQEASYKVAKNTATFDDFNNKVKSLERERLSEYIPNRAVKIYPENPISVDQILSNQNEDLISLVGDGCVFRGTLFDIMVSNLQYVKEVVIDTQENSELCMFWLGVAHGFGTNAMRVHRIYSSDEMKMMQEIGDSYIPQKHRTVIDLSGLWTAIYEQDNIDGFYKQLEKALFGMVNKRDLLIRDYIFGNEEEVLEEGDSVDEKLASYYRHKFWSALIDSNIAISLISKNSASSAEHEIKMGINQSDHIALNLITNYLGRRYISGNYEVRSFSNAQKNNLFDKYVDDYKGSIISIGDNVASKISDALIRKVESICHNACCYKEPADGQNLEGDCLGNKKRDIRTLTKKYKTQNKSRTLSAHYANRGCFGCSITQCQMNKTDSHNQLGQLIIARKTEGVDANKVFRNRFFVLIAGISGPATQAITSLFVDKVYSPYQRSESNVRQIDMVLYKEEHKTKNVYMIDDTIENEPKILYLLPEIQKQLRKKYLHDFKTSKCLIKMMKSLKQSSENRELDKEFERELDKELETLIIYLEHILSHYFLPMLTEEDVDGIRNKVWFFLHSSAYTNDILAKFRREIPNAIRDFLRQIVGVEILFNVKVKHSLRDKKPPTEDTRVPMEIGIIEIIENEQPKPLIELLKKSDNWEYFKDES